ncbi:MAG: hypothetical protein HOC70_07255 [Gammaproteobacteria bacterium]|jgi:fructose-specific phosphotransferase system component IIB|nr:hypothetical protein [Gammaproteobacteria bacterium]MBT4493025.1 hypothetical protein [Gammaproteobacteria bacterium]
MKYLYITLLLLVAGCGASGRIPDQEVSKADGEVVCRQERITGSHRQETVCRTKMQIRQETKDAKELMRRAQEMSTIGPSTTNKP